MEESLRILHVFQPPDGGLPEHVRLLAEGQRDRGHAVTVAGRQDAAPRRRLEELAIPYLPLPLTGRMPDPRPDTRAYRLLARLLSDRRFDIVHAHGQKAAALGRLAAARRGIPAVYTPNGLVYRTQSSRPRRGGRLRYQVGLRMEQALGRLTAAFIAVAADERDVAVADRLVPPSRAFIVHNAVTVDGAAAPDPRLLEIGGDGPLFGFIAGLREQKGLPFLLDALELLAERGTPLRFAIIGNGPLRDEIAARVRRAALARQTLLLPFDGRVEPYLRALDAFVLPSLWEGLPLAVLEAMWLCLPVVATAVNGTPEAVADGVTGTLVPPADAAALAEAMSALASDPAARQRMGAAGREAAERRFGVTEMVERVLSVYRGATAHPPARP
jgi:glycosyltransferase involved in cell wall biosynthesis